MRTYNISIARMANDKILCYIWALDKHIILVHKSLVTRFSHGNVADDALHQDSLKIFLFKNIFERTSNECCLFWKEFVHSCLYLTDICDYVIRMDVIVNFRAIHSTHKIKLTGFQMVFMYWVCWTMRWCVHSVRAFNVSVCKILLLFYLNFLSTLRMIMWFDSWFFSDKQTIMKKSHRLGSSPDETCRFFVPIILFNCH